MADLGTGARPDRADGADRALRASVAASMAGKAAELVTLLLLAVVVPRALGPEAYGRIAVPLTLVTVGSLAVTLGGPVVLGRFVPAAAPADRVALARTLGLRLARGRALQVVAVVVVTLGLAVAVPDRVPPGPAALVVTAFAANVVATLVLQVGLGLGRTGGWSTRYPLQNTVLVVGLLVLHDRHGYGGGLVAIVLAGAVAVAFAVAVTRPLLRGERRAVAVPEGAIRFGVLQATGAALTQFVHRSPVLAVALLGDGALETSYAALATGVALGVTYAVLQAFTVSLPHLAGEDASAPEAEAVLRRLAAGLTAVLALGLVPVALVLDDVLPVVFGDGYEDAAAAFGPALAVMVLAPAHSLGVQVAALRLRADVAAAAGGAAAVVFAGLALALVPDRGAQGATFAALLGVAAGTAVLAVRLPGGIGARLAAPAGAAALLVLALAGGW